MSVKRQDAGRGKRRERLRWTSGRRDRVECKPLMRGDAGYANSVCLGLCIGIRIQGEWIGDVGR